METVSGALRFPPSGDQNQGHAGHQTNLMRMVFDENGLEWIPGLVLNGEEEERMEKAHVHWDSHTGESQSEGF